MKKNKKPTKGPKILIIDIETAPLLVYTWGLFDQNIGLNQIKDDWQILSVSAKWHDPTGKVKYPTMYVDKRNSRDDKELLKQVWEWLDYADIVITQNGVKFDSKKLNARFILNGMQPPSSYRQIDTLKIARKYFAFTSNKLEYMTDKLCTKYKKLKHKKFPGFEMWKECMAGNKEAWKAMEKYNKYDVLSLEELYGVLQSWDNSIDFNVYKEECDVSCNCGSTSFLKRGFVHTNSGKYQRLRCNGCSKETKTKVNELSPEKRKSLRTRIKE